jgi:hypothetical protein
MVIRSSINVEYPDLAYMPHPTSFQLPEELLERLDDEATASGASATTLAATNLD